MDERLTIVVPVYKKPQSLIRLLDSIERFTSRDQCNVIAVLDDLDGHDGLSDAYPWVKCISTGNDGSGAVMAIWKGVLLSRDKYVGVLGDDCELVTPDTDTMIIRGIINGLHDEVIGLNDGVSLGRAHPFMSRYNWINFFGLPPCYCHYYGDTEIYTVARHWNRWKHLVDCRIIHHHEYCSKKGIAGVEVIEETKSKSKEKAKHDGEIFRKRMKWWEDNGKPRLISWNLI